MDELAREPPHPAELGRRRSSSTKPVVALSITISGWRRFEPCDANFARFLGPTPALHSARDCDDEFSSSDPRCDRPRATSATCARSTIRDGSRSPAAPSLCAGAPCFGATTESHTSSPCHTRTGCVSHESHEILPDDLGRLGLDSLRRRADADAVPVAERRSDVRHEHGHPLARAERVAAVPRRRRCRRRQGHRRRQQFVPRRERGGARRHAGVRCLDGSHVRDQSVHAVPRGRRARRSQRRWLPRTDRRLGTARFQWSARGVDQRRRDGYFVRRALLRAGGQHGGRWLDLRRRCRRRGSLARRGLRRRWRSGHPHGWTGCRAAACQPTGRWHRASNSPRW